MQVPHHGGLWYNRYKTKKNICKANIDQGSLLWKWQCPSEGTMLKIILLVAYRLFRAVQLQRAGLILHTAIAETHNVVDVMRWQLGSTHVRYKYPSMTILLSIWKGLTNWILRSFCTCRMVWRFAQSTITNSPRLKSTALSKSNIRSSVHLVLISKGFLQRLVLLHTTYLFLCLPAQFTWQFYLTQSYLFACFLLVLTLLCRTKHTKGLLRFLYSSN